MAAAVYRGAMVAIGRAVPKSIKPLWESDAGPQTIFFWAPIFKWSLVIAGIGDLQRPAERLSVTQASALTATGVIWSRYSMVIIPKNWNLFSVNIFVALTGIYQLVRIYNHRQGLKALESTEKVD